MRQLTSLPTWLLTRICCPCLPEDHPWRDRKFTLASWNTGQTDLCHLFDLATWVWLTFVIVTVIGSLV
jgi:hypothetical protein